MAGNITANRLRNVFFGLGEGPRRRRFVEFHERQGRWKGSASCLAFP